MLRLRFSRDSILAMIGAAAFAAFCVLQTRGGFGAVRGAPFPWYMSGDVILNGRLTVDYFWLGLTLDVLIWMAVILSIGFGVDWTKRILARRGKAS